MIIAYKLLLVTSDPKAFREFTDNISEQSFEIKQASKFSEAFDSLPNYKPELIILDARGNELSAIEFTNSAKSISRTRGILVIIVSDRKDEWMEISSFHSGADDFVLYPFNPNALIERLKFRLKSPNKTITVVQDYENSTPLKIDRESYTVSLGNRFIQLSRKEFELLYLMASNPEKLFGREEIFNLIWNKKDLGKNRTIDVHISRLRQKLGDRFISSQKGVGYRFVV